MKKKEVFNGKNVVRQRKKAGKILALMVLACTLGMLFVSCKQNGGANKTSSGADVTTSSEEGTISDVAVTEPTTIKDETTTLTTTGSTTTKPAESEDIVIDAGRYDDGGEPELIFVNAYAAVGQPLSVVLKNVENIEDVTYTWRVGSKQVCKEQTYTPTESDLEKFIKVTAKSGTKSYTAKIYFSELPVVYIDTENKKEVKDTETYINATCHIQGNSLYEGVVDGNVASWNTVSLYSGDIEIKGRGNASWTLGEREGKKPYKIKLDTKTDLFGMGKSKHWVLLADWNDKTVTRNIITNEFSKALGMDFSMELTNVILVFNGEYQGLYEMGEQVRIEDTRVDIFDWEELAEDAAKKIAKKNGLDDAAKDGLEDALVTNLSWVTSDTVTYKGATYKVSDYIDVPDNIFGGYLLEVDMYYDTVSKFMTEGLTNDEFDAQPVMFKSPEYAYTNVEMFNYIKGCINVFERAVRSSTHFYEDANLKVHYSKVVDMESLVQYWLVNEFSNNFDSMKNSLFIYQDLGGMFEFGPAWDYDLAFGNKGDAAKYNKWQTLSYEKKHQAYQWYKYLIKDPYFLVQAYELYHEKAAPYIDSILADGGRLDTLQEYLEKAGLANVKAWYQGKYDYNMEVDSLNYYIKSRKAWFDKQFKTVDSLILSLRSYTAYNKLTIKEMAEASGDFNVMVSDGNVKKVLVLMNGKDIGTYDVVDGKVVLSGLAEYRRAEGKLNVIEVFGLDSKGKNLTYGSQPMKNYLVFE